jgi:hypothetical protein
MTIHPLLLSLVAVPALLFAACGPVSVGNGDGDAGGGGAQLSVEAGSYRAGAQIVLTLTNRSPDMIGYNLCPAALERRTGDSWATVPERPAEVCTMELRTLAPGSSDDFPHTLPATLTPGEYRFRVGIEAPLGGSQVTLVSNGFQVTQ